jgi:hypothetical protein
MRYRVTLRHEQANCEFVVFIDAPEPKQPKNQTAAQRKAASAFQVWATLTEELRESSALKVIRVEETPQKVS